MNRKLLLLGLDSANLNYIKSRQEVLPCLKKLIQEGKTNHLKIPKALNGSVWPTFYNGANPGIHGVYQHLVWDADKMGIRRISSDKCYYQPFWQKIETSGYSVIALDVPYTFPSLKKGIEITDWATNGLVLPLACNNDKVKKMVIKMGKNPLDRETPVKKTISELKRIKSQVIKSAKLKGELITKLITQQEWDLFIGIFAETHRGGHLFFNQEDAQEYKGKITPLLEVYQEIDRSIANILTYVDSNTEVIIFAVNSIDEYYAPRHLAHPVMKKINQVFLEKYLNILPTIPGKKNGLISSLRKATPNRLEHFIGANSPDWFRQWIVEREIVGGLNWKYTPGFCLRTDIRTEIRLNLKDRESQGILERGSPLEKQYINFVKEVFLQLQDNNTNKLLVDEVIETHEIFSGENLDLLPDLVVTWLSQPTAQSVYSPLIGTISTKANIFRGGDHTDDGFVIIPEQLENLSPLNKVEDFAQFCHAFFHIPSATIN